MKKLLLTMTGVLVLLTAASAQGRLFLSLGANMIRPADAAYRSIYGNQALYPELGVAIRTVGGLCVIGSFGQFAKNGKTPDLGLETRSKQSYVTGGLGYLFQISGALCLEAGAGVAAMKFSENALDTEIDGQKMGLMAEAGAIYMQEEGQGFFLGLKLGFLSATVNDISSDIAGSQPVKLGGVKISVSVGIQLFGNR
jgi:hypothetical protein